jgi:hypothetical protein
VKAVAGWRFERGTTLGFLEQLLGSGSLYGALQTQWSLRAFNIAGMVLVALAILSPLGGQASLQMLKREEKPIFSEPNAVYLDTEQQAYSWFESGTYYYYALPPLNAMYTSSLMAPESVKNSPMDLWGNIKIPYLSRLSSSPNNTGWKDVPAQNVLYSSLVGIPVSGLPEPANTSFTMETSYLDLDCYNITNGSFINTTIADQSATKFWGMQDNTYSISLDGFLPLYYGTVWSYVNETNRTFPQRTLLFQSQAEYGSGFTLAYCYISTAYVEAAIECAGHACTVTNMRPSQKRHPDPLLVPLDFPIFFNEFSAQFGLATGNDAPETSSTTELYIQNPVDPFSGGDRVTVDLYKLPRDEMAVRLGQVLNTYYLGSLSPWGFMGLTSAAELSDGATGNISVTAVSTTNRVVFVCQWAWWVVFIFANIVMLITASVGAILHWHSTGPDILGYVSSMTRDSPYVRLPPGGSTLDGMERARLLKGVEVQLRDVQEKQETGRLAFASPERELVPLAKGRIYS